MRRIEHKSLPADIGILSGFRNKIINGDFDVWQRGTSGATGYMADRWSGSVVVATATQARQTFTPGQTDVPGNPKYFHRYSVTAHGGAPAAINLVQGVEGVQTLAGKTATLTFWAKADAAKNLYIEFLQSFGTGGSPSSGITNIEDRTVALTTSWQKFSYTVAIPSIAGKTLGSNGGDSLKIAFWVNAGADYASRVASGISNQTGVFDIAHISLVEGDATDEDDPFAPRHPQQEVALCQRYYQKAGLGTSGYAYATTGVLLAGTFLVPMRTTPTATLLTTAPMVNSSTASSFTGSGSTIIAAVTDSRGHRTSVNGFTGLTVGDGAVGLTNDLLGFDAEL